MTPHAAAGRALDEGAVERHAQGAVLQAARLQRNERVAAEEPGAYGRPLGDAGRVVEIHLVYRADLHALAVERLAADQVARIDVALHGPSNSLALHPIALRKGTMRPTATRTFAHGP